MSYGDLFFWAPYNNPMRGIIYIVFVVCNVGLIIFGIRSFRDAELRSRRPWLRVALCAALYLAAYFLRTPVYMLMDGLPGRALAVAFDMAGMRCWPVRSSMAPWRSGGRGKTARRKMDKTGEFEY